MRVSINLGVDKAASLLSCMLCDIVYKILNTLSQILFVDDSTGVTKMHRIGKVSLNYFYWRAKIVSQR